MSKKVLTLVTFTVLLLSTGSAFANQFNTPVPTLSQAQDTPIPMPMPLPGKLDTPIPPPMPLPGA